MANAGEDEDVSPSLPSRLKPDKPLVRTGVMQRLAASRLFAYGDRAGVLKAASNRSSRPFRLDVRQRVIVKALVSRHFGRCAERGVALLRHVTYLTRPGAGLAQARAEFFDARSDAVDGHARAEGWADHRHHFRFIVSPEHGDRLRDLADYTRELMRRVTADLGEPDLPWMAVCHYDTDQPHAHVLMPGRRADGRDLVIPRDYVGYGFRARAQEVAQERLGDLSRADAERRIWKETQADRFTAFDRRLVASAGADGVIDDAFDRPDAWSALTRGRIAHLEKLGLAIRRGRRVTLAPDLSQRLARLQTSRDIIRSLNSRKIERGVEVRIAQEGRLRGRVTAAGFHDELGSSPWATIEDDRGIETYVRLRTGTVLPKTGAAADIAVNTGGVGEIASGQRSRGRGADSGLYH